MSEITIILTIIRTGKNVVPNIWEFIKTEMFYDTDPYGHLWNEDTIYISSEDIFSWLNGPRHAKTCLWTYVDIEGPGQLVNPHGLIRTFTVRWQNYWILQNVWMKYKGQDNTLYKIIRICTFFACSKARFRLKQTILWLNSKLLYNTHTYKHTFG